MQRPLLYSDVFEFRHPGDPEVLYDWDNGDLDQFGPPPGSNVNSFESCGQACVASPACVQWLWRGEEEQRCVLMKTPRLGIPRMPEDIVEPRPQKDGDKKDKDLPEVPPKVTHVDFTSGWMRERIDKWRAARQCDVVQWVGPSITRIY